MSEEPCDHKFPEFNWEDDNSSGYVECRHCTLVAEADVFLGPWYDPDAPKTGTGTEAKT